MIVDFHPGTFPAQAREPFFYCTRMSLKYGESITSNTDSLYTAHGRLGNPLVSPDHSRIAFVDDEQLLVASHNEPIRRVATVDSIYHGFDDDRKKPIGHDFFRDSDYQWSSDSRYLYLIHDQFYDSQGTQLYSKHGELWKYDLETGGLQLVLKPFSAYQFFFGKSGIYFSVPTSLGDLQLEYFDGKQVVNIGQPNDHFSPNTILNGKTDQIFYSFSITDSPSRSRPVNGLTTAFDGAAKKKKYQAGEQYLMSISEGATFKGPYYCGSDSVDYLPGQQFAVLNMVGCDPYDGQLLIDLSGARYMQLPKDTYVYISHNTQEEPNFAISGGGITR